MSLLYVHWLHSSSGTPRGPWRRSDETAVFNLEASVQRILRLDKDVSRPTSEVEKELSSRFISYTGEEVPKMEPLTLSQIEPALPPSGHGGSIPVIEWTKGRTRSFLTKPEQCIVEDVGQNLPKHSKPKCI